MSTDTQADPAQDTPEGEAADPRDCRFCDLSLAVAGIVSAVVIVLVSIDLAKGGALTLWALRLIGRGRADDDAD